MADISIDKYEADAFMTTSRAAKVTRVVAAALKKGINAGRYGRWRFLSDSLYREQILDNLVTNAVRHIYTEFHRKSGDIDNPRPSSRLVRELARAYRKKARGLTSITRIVMRGLGALFEDESDAMRPVIRPSALAQAALNTARHFRGRYLTVSGRLTEPRRTALRHDTAMLNKMLEDVIGSGGLTQAEIDEIALILNGLQSRANS